MKIIKYEFADGIKEIEVNDEFAAVYEKILEEEKKLERKETRRHSSLEGIEETGYQFSAEIEDFDEIIEKEELEELERTRDDEKILRDIIRREKRILKKILSSRQFEAYCAYHYKEMKKVEIAKIMGITEGSVRKLIKKAENKAEEAYKKEIL